MLKYESVVSDLIQKIDSGVYAPSSPLPTTAKLCQMYGVSKITIKRAMDELEAVGMITRRRGAGTFVKNAHSGAARHLNWQGETGILGTKSQYAELGYDVRSCVHGFSVIKPPARVAEALGMDDGFVYHITRSRFVDDRPICVEYTYMPIALIPGITMEVLEDSIYQYIERDLDLAIDSAHSTIRATLPTLEECEWLGIDANYPLLEVEQTAFLADGTTFEYSVTRHTKFDNDIRTVRFHRFDTA